MKEFGTRLNGVKKNGGGYLREEAILPPSTVRTAPVVFLEVAKWKKDPTYALKIWMYPGKTMYLHPILFTHSHLGYP